MFYKRTYKERILEKVLIDRKPQNRVPIWFMRQAGRYLPEYHEAMHNVTDLMQAFYHPDIIEKVTLQPILRFDIDAAIIFSDIMVVADALGYLVSFPRGSGPQVTNSKKDIPLEKSLEKLSPIFSGISRVRSSLNADKSLIGFAAAPWTLATYILGRENFFSKIRQMYCSNDKYLNRIIDRITELTSLYLVKQIESGANVIQLFDSNAYVLPVDMFKRFVIEPTQKIVSHIQAKHPSVPIIGFPKGSGVMYKEYSEKTNISAVSIDYSIPIDWIQENIHLPVQGNLDPFLLTYDIDKAIQHTRLLLSELRDKPLVFNLGHGILKETPVENVESVISFIRSFNNG